MVTVKYKLISSPFLGGDALILLGVTDGPHDLVKIELDGIKSGILILGEKAFSITDGAAAVEYGIFPDGPVAPYVKIGKRSLFAMPLIKSRDGIKIASDADGYTRLLSLYLELEAELCTCRDSINELSERIKGHSLFNFLQNKKG